MHQRERGVLRYEDLHLVGAEAAVLDEAEIVLPGGYRARAAADGLEIGVGNAAYLLDCAQDSGAHSVAARDVLGASFGEEHRVGADLLAECDGVEIVRSAGSGDELDAAVELLGEPHVVDVVDGDADHYRNLVVRADLGEGARGVAG